MEDFITASERLSGLEISNSHAFVNNVLAIMALLCVVIGCLLIASN